ncbi:hypothetical protein BRD17_06805 [Halobacteriales archaeon SW_7_68_16]|nr:MAG: hypothetical protein BRD17_06805 [Halobacteriales archaeon SW_7_68_16]
MDIFSANLNRGAMAEVEAGSRGPGVADIYERLVALDDYEPGPTVSTLFEYLVDRVLYGEGAVDLDPGQRRELRAIAATAEYRLERHWADRIVAAADPVATLAEFPYVENYRTLARLEHGGVVGVDKTRPMDAVFVGGGPLPLSAIVLARDHDWPVTVIDRDPDAVASARRITDALGVDVAVREVDGSICDYGGHDVVHVAALAGSDGGGSDEDGVYDRIATTADDGTGGPLSGLTATSLRSWRYSADRGLRWRRG